MAQVDTVPIEDTYGLIFESASALIATILNLIILHKEYRKRKSNQVTTFKWAKYCTFICMVSGTIFTCLSIIASFRTICFIAKPMKYFMSVSQASFMGFIQVSRLYFCLSQKQTNSDSIKGYPQCVFIVMIMIGFGLILSGLISPWFWIDYLCSIEVVDNDQDLYKYIVPHSWDIPYWDMWVTISVFIYMIWYITTIFLYLFKILAYKNNQRIRKILGKIVILTLLPGIIAFWGAVSGIIAGYLKSHHLDAVAIISAILASTSWQFAAVITNISIFLMQSHNEKQYKQFLRLLYKLKIYHLCCACKEVFTLDDDDENKNEQGNMEEVDEEGAITKNYTTTIEAIPLHFDGTSPRNGRDRPGTIQTHTKTELVMSQMIAK